MVIEGCYGILRVWIVGSGHSGACEDRDGKETEIVVDWQLRGNAARRRHRGEYRRTWLNQFNYFACISIVSHTPQWQSRVASVRVLTCMSCNKMMVAPISVSSNTPIATTITCKQYLFTTPSSTQHPTHPPQCHSPTDNCNPIIGI